MKNEFTAGCAVKRKKRADRNVIELWSMTVIPILFIVVFCYLPMFGIIIAFKDYKYSRGIWGSKWVGFDNFKFFVLSNDCARLVRNTLSLNLLFIATLMIAEIALAIVFYELTSRKALKTYQTILITPNFISWVTIGYVVYAFLQPQYGIINNLLKSLGMQGIQFYNTPAVWPGILNFDKRFGRIVSDNRRYRYIPLQNHEGNRRYEAFECGRIFKSRCRFCACIYHQLCYQKN